MKLSHCLTTVSYAFISSALTVFDILTFGCQGLRMTTSLLANSDIFMAINMHLSWETRWTNPINCIKVPSLDSRMETMWHCCALWLDISSLFHCNIHYSTTKLPWSPWSMTVKVIQGFYKHGTPCWAENKHSHIQTHGVTVTSCFWPHASYVMLELQDVLGLRCKNWAAKTIS